MTFSLLADSTAAIWGKTLTADIVITGSPQAIRGALARVPGVDTVDESLPLDLITTGFGDAISETAEAVDPSTFIQTRHSSTRLLAGTVW